MLTKIYTLLGFCLYFGLILLFPFSITAQDLHEERNIEQKNRNKPSNLVAIIPLERPSETPTDKLIKVQRILRTYSNLGRFSGVAILAQHGKPIHRFTTKYSTLDFKIRCALSTQFNTCDMTQVFTAVTIMQLVEQEKIKLTDNVGMYLMDVPSPIGATTIHQLLTHTAGLNDYYDLEEYQQNFHAIKQPEELLQLTLKYPQIEENQTLTMRKSTTGYLLLGSILHKVSGMPYQEYIQKHIFQPNDMTNSGLYSWFSPAEQQAVGYIVDELGRAAEAPYYWGAHAFGADGVHCSIEDLLKFHNAFQGGNMLNAETRRTMLSKQFSTSNTSTNYLGYGWKIKELADQKIFYQGGHLGGISSALRHFTKDNYTFLIYSNYGENRANIIADKVEEILTTDHVTIPNHTLGYILYEQIEEEGSELVVANFDNILRESGEKLKDIWPLYSLGQDYLKENKVAVALQLFQLAAAKFPNKPLLYDAIGDSYHLLGNKEMAQQAFQNKLRLLPNDSRAKRMLKVIESTDYVVIRPNKPQKGVKQIEAVNTFSIQPKPQAILASNSIPNTSNNVLLNDSVLENEEESVLKLSDSSTPQIMETTADTGEDTEEEVLKTVEIMPEFPGGQPALHQYLSKNLRYPTIAYIKNIEGVVYAEFVIDIHGNVIQAKVSSPVEGDDGGLSMEAMRLINNMPRWTSGSHEGKAVNVKLTIPIQFNKGYFIKNSADR